MLIKWATGETETMTRFGRIAQNEREREKKKEKEVKWKRTTEGV